MADTKENTGILGRVFEEADKATQEFYSDPDSGFLGPVAKIVVEDATDKIGALGEGLGLVTGAAVGGVLFGGARLTDATVGTGLKKALEGGVRLDSKLRMNNNLKKMGALPGDLVELTFMFGFLDYDNDITLRFQDLDVDAIRAQLATSSNPRAILISHAETLLINALEDRDRMDVLEDAAGEGKREEFKDRFANALFHSDSQNKYRYLATMEWIIEHIRKSDIFKGFELSPFSLGSDYSGDDLVLVNRGREAFTQESKSQFEKETDNAYSTTEIELRIAGVDVKVDLSEWLLPGDDLIHPTTKLYVLRDLVGLVNGKFDENFASGSITTEFSKAGGFWESILEQIEAELGNQIPPVSLTVPDEALTVESIRLTMFTVFKDYLMDPDKSIDKFMEEELKNRLGDDYEKVDRDLTEEERSERYDESMPKILARESKSNKGLFDGHHLAHSFGGEKLYDEVGWIWNRLYKMKGEKREDKPQILDENELYAEWVAYSNVMDKVYNVITAITENGSDTRGDQAKKLKKTMDEMAGTISKRLEEGIINTLDGVKAATEGSPSFKDKYLDAFRRITGSQRGLIWMRKHKEVSGGDDSVGEAAEQEMIQLLKSNEFKEYFQNLRDPRKAKSMRLLIEVTGLNDHEDMIKDILSVELIFAPPNVLDEELEGINKRIESAFDNSLYTGGINSLSLEDLESAAVIAPALLSDIRNTMLDFDNAMNDLILIAEVSPGVAKLKTKLEEEEAKSPLTPVSLKKAQDALDKALKEYYTGRNSLPNLQNIGDYPVPAATAGRFKVRLTRLFKARETLRESMSGDNYPGFLGTPPSDVNLEVFLTQLENNAPDRILKRSAERDLRGEGVREEIKGRMNKMFSVLEGVPSPRMSFGSSNTLKRNDEITTNLLDNLNISQIIPIINLNTQEKVLFYTINMLMGIEEGKTDVELATIYNAFLTNLIGTPFPSDPEKEEMANYLNDLIDGSYSGSISYPQLQWLIT